MMHEQGLHVHKSTHMEDTLFGLRRGTHSSIDGGAPTVQAWNGAGDQLELVTGQSDGAHPTDLQHQFPKGHIPVPLPFSQVPRFILDM